MKLSQVIIMFPNFHLQVWCTVEGAVQDQSHLSHQTVLMNGPISHKLHVSILVVPQLEM